MLKHTRIHAVLLACLFALQTPLIAQSDGAGLANPTLWIVFILVLVMVAGLIGNGLIRAQASMEGVDVDRDDSSFFPWIGQLFGRGKPSFVGQDSFKTLTKGHNINLEGAADTVVRDVNVRTYAIQPTNYRGIAPIPKMMVEIGAHVKAGDPIFYDKANPDIHFCAPVSGEVIEVRRGAKRAITAVIISADADQQYRTFDSIDTQTADRATLVEHLMRSGLWPAINQRPYDVIADPTVSPRDIFISTFDTAPLAPKSDMILHADTAAAFQQGVNVLAKLTDGDVHLGLDVTAGPDQVASHIQGVKRHWFSGPHPAGNVGIQIHHTAPIRPGHVVWTLDTQDVIAIGEFIMNQRYAPTRTIAVCGQSVETPSYVRVAPGALVSDILAGQIHTDEEVRIISGDVLSGEQKTADDFINGHDDQLTVIPEGRHHELFGWLIPAFDRPTLSKTYLTHLASDLEFEVDTNTHGEPRAFVQTGQYEAVLPADIYPQHLMKAIMINDYERMEGLGIHELTEEDVALCEFTCTSKQPLQQILRDGLDYMREQEG